MYLFDTDTLSNLTEAGRNYPQLQRRVLQTNASLIYISIVTIEENLPRLLNRIHNDRNTQRVVERYQALLDYFYVVGKFQILPFDEKALAEFQKIPSKLRQHHSNDCRIAVIAMSKGFTVITGNTGDFNKIPHVITENWMREEQEHVGV